MATTGNDAPLPAFVVRLKNSVRVELKDDADAAVKQRFGRDFFVMQILRGYFKVPVSAIFCLQDFTTAGFLDLTFCTLSDCAAFYANWNKSLDNALLTGLLLRPAFVQDFVPLTIHLYNPFVEDGDVLAFLARHCDTVRGGERLKDHYGIWTGKRRFMVKLKPDPLTSGGLIHPPGSFAIGSNKGFLHYPGQPMYCRKCGDKGHVKADCKGERCKFCGGLDHRADACSAPKHCSLCGSVEHLYRTCPARKKSYASLLVEGAEYHPRPQLQPLRAPVSSVSGAHSSVAAFAAGEEPDGAGASGGELIGSISSESTAAVPAVLGLQGAAQVTTTSDGSGSEGEERPWSEIDIDEVVSRVPSESQSQASSVDPRSLELTKFTWSQLDALDVLMAEQDQGPHL